ncbi:MAG TPA: hypothetical protein VMS86_09655 [Thermoanaerobaculia bacterium]|nr:hypothetical protein [Thermoanaerobaculia bacterium]
MSRSTRLAFLALTVFLVLLPLTLAKPGLPVNLKADEPAYYLMALSLARDRDLRLEVQDVDRLFEEFPLLPARNLIVMSDDGWRTIHYSKPLLYPLLGAPFAAALGANGLLLFNMLLVGAMVWMGTRHLRRHNDDALALLVSAAFVLLSCGFAYAFWIHTEIFCMAAVAAACFLVLGAAERERRPSLLAPLGSGAALALAAYHKPTYALVGAALLFAAWRAWRLRGAAAWLAGAGAVLGATVLLSIALVGRATPYLGSQLRAGVSVCTPGKLPIEPAPAPPAVTGAPAEGGATATGAPASEDAPPRLNWGFVLRVPSTDPRELAESLRYFLWGRHTGFLLYFPFGVLAVLLFALDRPRDGERWLLLASLAGIALYFLVFIPVNWQGGGGFVGNRYFVAVYPAFLYLVRRVRPAVMVVPAVAVSSLFLGPLLLSPFGAAVPEPTLQAHVRNAPFHLFPLELSLKNVPGYHVFPLAEARLLARRDQVVPFGESMWLRGADRVEVWIESAHPVKRPAFLVERFGPGNEVTLAIGAARETIAPAGPAEPRRVVLEPERATRRRRKDGAESWVYKLVVRSSSGAVESWTRSRTARRCGDFEFEDPRVESFFVGAGLTYIGDAADHERDLFAPEWGSVRVPERVAPGATFEIETVVTNRSPHPWSGGGSSRINLSYHWLAADGRMVVYDGLRTPLPGPVEPGATLRAAQAVAAPPEPGSYLLELDLVYEHVAWFSQRSGGRTLRLPVEVAPPPVPD